MTIQQAFEFALQHHQSGGLAEAEALYRQILAADPRHADALHLLGVIAHQAGRNDFAVNLIRQAIAVAPGVAGYFSNLGEAHRALGQLEEAIVAYHQAIALRPDYPEAYSNLGNALKDQGHPEEAIAAYRQAIALNPAFADAHSNLGISLYLKGYLDEAIAAYRRAIALKPENPIALSNLGIALQGRGKLDEAIASYRAAIALNPAYPEAHSNLGNALKDQGRLDEAVEACLKAIALNPAYPEAHNNLGNALKDRGQLDEAIAAYRQAVALRPDDTRAHSNLLFTLNYHPGINSRAVSEEHRRWNVQHAKPVRQFTQPHANDRDPERVLRIGYVSADFRDHSVAIFFESLLEKHDRTHVEVFCYSDVADPDAVTARLEQSAGNWRQITGMPDVIVADLICKDGIDILVDLAGHTAHNRLRMFAGKPAPVQVSWLGYPHSTGLETMDYRLTDAFTDPPGSSEDLHTEHLVRLPGSFACFRPVADAPPVGPQSAAGRGVVTFASFHTLAKLNDELLECWAKILVEAPGSRLMLVSAGLDEPSSQARFAGFFARRGISSGRLDFKARQTAAAYFALHQEVDVLLDSHPFSGHTVSCHALWMGVPVVSLSGERHCSRMVTSVLMNLGMPELVAQTPAEYVQIAVGLARDLPRLAHYRDTLRERMEASTLMDAPRFARGIEAAYREMWTNWCARKTKSPAS